MRELSRSKKEIEKNVGNLNEVLKNIRAAVYILTNFSKELEESAQEMRKHMESQGANLQETAVSIEEVSASFDTIAATIETQNKNIQSNKGFVLEYAKRTRSHPYSQVAGSVYDEIQAIVRKKCRALVDSQPSSGRTIR